MISQIMEQLQTIKSIIKRDKFSYIQGNNKYRDR